MTRDVLYRSMDVIDDDILAEAVSPEKVANAHGERHGWWIVAVTCFCLITGIGAMCLFGGSHTVPVDPQTPEPVVGKTDTDLSEHRLVLNGKQDTCFLPLTYQDYIRFGLLPEETPNYDTDMLAAMCYVPDEDIGIALGTVTTAGNPNLLGKTAYLYKTASGDNVCIVESDGGYEFFYRKAVLQQENAVAAYELLDLAFGHDTLGFTLFPDDYAGSYIDGDKLVLLLTDVREEALEKYKTWAAQYADVLVFKEADYPYNVLKETAETIFKELKGNGYVVTTYYVSETANRIQISIANVTSTQAAEIEGLMEKAYRVPVTVVAQENTFVTTTP